MIRTHVIATNTFLNFERLGSEATVLKINAAPATI